MLMSEAFVMSVAIFYALLRRRRKRASRRNNSSNRKRLRRNQGTDDLSSSSSSSSRLSYDNLCEHGETPLHIAAENGDTDAVRALIRDGADIHAKTGYGSTPMNKAISMGHIDVINVLVEAGVDVRERDDEGWTTLHAAAMGMEDTGDVIKTLVDHGAEVDAITDDEEETPLLYAVLDESNESIVKALIDAGANVNLKRSNGKSPLLYAALNGSLVMTKDLIKAGAEVNAQDEDGFTPLMFAGGFNYTNIVETLIYAGADINLETCKGFTALENTVLHGHVETSDCLIKYTVLFNDKMEKPKFVVADAVLSNLWDFYTEQVQKLQTINIDPSSTITLYKLLRQRDENQLASYVSDQQVIKEELKFAAKQHFPAYYKFMVSQFTRGKKRQCLLRKTSVVMAHCDLIKLPPEIRKRIAGFSRNQDLLSFVKAALSMWDNK